MDGKFMDFDKDMATPRFEQPCAINFYFTAGNCGSCDDSTRQVIFFTYEYMETESEYWGNIWKTIVIIFSMWGWMPWALLANIFWEDYTFYQEKLWPILVENQPKGTTAWKLFWNDEERNDELYEWFKYNKAAYGF
jgi:hypothetical protein